LLVIIIVKRKKGENNKWKKVKG
jgi:hypothetical protein